MKYVFFSESDFPFLERKILMLERPWNKDDKSGTMDIPFPWVVEWSCRRLSLALWWSSWCTSRRFCGVGLFTVRRSTSLATVELRSPIGSRYAG